MENIFFKNKSRLCFFEIIKMYTKKEDIYALIPQNMVQEALTDKNGTFTEDEVFAELQETIADEIHWRISPKVKVPFLSEIPAIIKRAALIFSCEAIFERRKVAPKDNPFFEKAEHLREKLDAIGSGKAPISVGLSKSKSSVVVISKPAKTTSSTGRLSQ